MNRNSVYKKRAKLLNARDFVDNTKEEEDRLSKLMELTSDNPAKLKAVDVHVSKSRILSIMSETGSKSDVKVVWLAQNFSSYYLGVKFEKPVCSTLLYPISGVFNQPPSSSHVIGAPVDPLPNFLKASILQEWLKTLGMDCRHRFVVPIVLRYLREVASLNQVDVMRYNEELDIQHGADKKPETLLEAVGLKFKESSYEDYLVLPENSIFEKITVVHFDTKIGGSSIVVELKADILLPELPFPRRNIFVKASETTLSAFIKTAKKGDIEFCFPVKILPLNSLEYRPDSEYGQKMVRLYGPGEQLPFTWMDIDSIHYSMNADFKTIIFNTPNILDAVMTALFLVKAVDPVAQKCFGPKVGEK